MLSLFWGATAADKQAIVSPPGSRHAVTMDGNTSTGAPAHSTAAEQSSSCSSACGSLKACSTTGAAAASAQSTAAEQSSSSSSACGSLKACSDTAAVAASAPRTAAEQSTAAIPSSSSSSTCGLSKVCSETEAAAASDQSATVAVPSSLPDSSPEADHLQLALPGSDGGAAPPASSKRSPPQWRLLPFEGTDGQQGDCLKQSATNGPPVPHLLLSMTCQTCSVPCLVSRSL